MHRVLLTALLVIFVLLLAGCGGESPTSPNGGPNLVFARTYASFEVYTHDLINSSRHKRYQSRLEAEVDYASRKLTEVYPNGLDDLGMTVRIHLQAKQKGRHISVVSGKNGVSKILIPARSPDVLRHEMWHAFCHALRLGCCSREDEDYTCGMG